MNETTGQTTSSSLGIIEKKRAHRSGGCVGIFFPLFDWNRRFTRKKFFSRKLLASVGAKQGSINFRADERMPKARCLIADENSGGLSNMKKNVSSSRYIVEKKEQTRAPGLVARLMGLESMPAVHVEKHKKLSNSVTCSVGEEKDFNGHCGSDREGWNSDEVGNVKIDSRPQKLQKTGQIDTHAVVKFGSKALEINGVLSRAKRHNYHKLASPVNEPRISSSRNGSRSSRLIQAATRILEPGIQAKNRAKCALTYSTRYAPVNEVLEDGTFLSPNVASYQQGDVNCDAGLPKFPIEQTSCKNCGNLLNVMDAGQNDHRFGYSFSSKISSQRSERMKPMSPISSPEQHKDADLSEAAKKQENVPAYASGNNMLHGKPLSRRCQVAGQPRSQQFMPPKNMPSSIAVKSLTPSQNEMCLTMEKMPSRTRINILRSKKASSAAVAVNRGKDFVALNRSSNGHTQPNVSTKAENSKINNERRACGWRDDSLPHLRTPIHKRRAASTNRHVENIGPVNSLSNREKYLRRDVVNRNKSGLISHSTGQIRTKSVSEVESTNGDTNNDVVSFTFSSPLKKRTSTSIDLKEGRNKPNNIKSSLQRNQVVNDKHGNSSLQRELPVQEVALTELLELKLKELTSQEDYELATEGMQSKRSMAMILQDLISALAAEQPISPCGRTYDRNLTSFELQEKIGVALGGLSYTGHNLSPGSVLEASFCNDSIISSNTDDNLGGQGLVPDSIECSYNQQRSIQVDADLWDSAASMTDRSSGVKTVIDVISDVSMILQRINLASGGLKSWKLLHAREVILNAELLFGNATPNVSPREQDSLIACLLLDELSTIAGSVQTHLGFISGFVDCKEDSRFRSFLFDIVIECLDRKYGHYSSFGFKAWKRAHLHTNAQIIMGDVVEEIRRWTSWAGMDPDEIIEWEMSHGLGKWMDFEREAYETGWEVDEDILRDLVEEVVIDLWKCKPSSLQKHK